ncbi:MAG: flagellar protein FliT [Methylobacter sp.]
MKDESTLDIRTQKDQLLRLTQAMLASAESDDWDEFELQEQQRNVLLNMIFGSQDSAELAKLHLVDVVKEILLIDQAITNLIRQQRDQAAEELRRFRNARAGSKAYQIAIDDPM